MKKLLKWIAGLFIRNAYADVTSFAVTYYRNRNTSDTEAYVEETEEAESLDVVGIEDTEFEYDGFEFTGWNTARDGSGTWVDEGTTLTEATTLYAIWEDVTPTYTVRGSELTAIADAIRHAAEADIHNNLLDSDGWADLSLAPNATSFTVSGYYESETTGFSACPLSIKGYDSEGYNVYTYSGSVYLQSGIIRIAVSIIRTNLSGAVKLKVEPVEGKTVTRIQVNTGSKATPYRQSRDSLVFPDEFESFASGLMPKVEWEENTVVFPTQNTTIASGAILSFAAATSYYSRGIKNFNVAISSFTGSSNLVAYYEVVRSGSNRSLYACLKNNSNSDVTIPAESCTFTVYEYKEDV